MAVTTYNVVPLSGRAGAQKVDGHALARKIAQEIADRERADAAVTPDRAYARQTLIRPRV
jgi:hypothetical protein